jgi:beta-glucosidase
MTAYHSYDSVPAVADNHSLTKILRGECGYEYFVMSDAVGADHVCNLFEMCSWNSVNSDAIVNGALPAGTDVEMGGGSYNYHNVLDLVKSGKLNVSFGDQAVSRFL